MEVDNLIGQFFDLVPDEIAEVFVEGFSYGVRFMIEALYIYIEPSNKLNIIKSYKG